MRILILLVCGSFGFCLGSSSTELTDLVNEMARAGQVKALKVLEGQGVDWNATGHIEETTLHHACLSGSLECVQFLVNKGVAINSRDRLGRTPCLVAAEKGHGTIVNFLLGKGASPNVRDNLGYTPIWWACVNKDMFAIKSLIHHGAKLNDTDQKGRRPLDVVRFDVEHMSVTRFLIDLGAQKGSHKRNDGDLGALLRARRDKEHNALVGKEGVPWTKAPRFTKKSVEQNYYFAKAYLVTGHLEKATPLIEQVILNEGPSCQACLLLKAELFGKRRLYEEASALIDELESLNVDSSEFVELNMSIGKTAFKNQDFDHARTFFQSAEAKTSQPPAELNYFLGCLADDQNELEKARTYLTSYLNGSSSGHWQVDARERLENLSPSVLPIMSFDGRRLDLADFKGQWVLLDFWTAGNHYKNKVFKALQKINSSLASDGFVLISINIDRDENPARDLVTWLNPEWPQYLDPSLKTGRKRYQVESIPAFILLSPDGQIHERFTLDDVTKSRKLIRKLKKMME